MKQSAVFVLSALAAVALADQPIYAQCGGIGWSGDTKCVSGTTCVYGNDWYSQCLPGSGGSNPNPTTAQTTPKTTPSQPTPTYNGGVTTVFPNSAGSTALPTAKVISGTFDGGMLRWERNPAVCQGQTETGEKDAMFILENGAHIKNVMIGASQAEGIHCRGTCTIENVWWLDVCEDAATFKQSSGTSYVIGGGARNADDKVFQFNGRGTVSIKNFYAKTAGKLIRSCGDCDNNGGPRHVLVDGAYADGVGPFCGINSNYGDTCRISNSCNTKGKTCELYKGVSDHNGSSTKLSSGPDNKSCWVTNPTC